MWCMLKPCCRKTGIQYAFRKQHILDAEFRIQHISRIRSKTIHDENIGRARPLAYLVSPRSWTRSVIFDHPLQNTNTVHRHTSQRNSARKNFYAQANLRWLVAARNRQRASKSRGVSTRKGLKAYCPGRDESAAYEFCKRPLQPSA